MKYTKWIPLGESRYGDHQHLIMVRGNKKSGELFFITKRVNRAFINGVGQISQLPIDVAVQWQLINKLLNE